MEVLVVIVIAVLVLGVAIGPLLAMRNPAEADKLTPGADPADESSKEPDASESSVESPTPRHTEDQPSLPPWGTGISRWLARCPI